MVPAAADPATVRKVLRFNMGTFPPDGMFRTPATINRFAKSCFVSFTAEAGEKMTVGDAKNRPKGGSSSRFPSKVAETACPAREVQDFHNMPADGRVWLHINFQQ